MSGRDFNDVMQDAGIEEVKRAFDGAQLVCSATVASDARAPIHQIATTDEFGKPRPQASIILDIGKTHHLFHDDDREPYARVWVGNHYEVFAVRDEPYRELLAGDFYRLTRRGANRNALTDATSTLAAQAKHDGPRETVGLRVQCAADHILVDVGDEAWTCFDVSPAGWNHVDEFRANFRRSGKPLSLPMPSTSSNFSRIWRYLNVEAADRVLVAAWLLGAFRPRGPYPILLLIGEQGSGKSGATRVLKRFCDPSTVPLRAPPKDEKDLMVAAISSRVLALDNLSGASPQMSDALCRLATGGGFSARKLYSDSTETLIDVQRPVLLNGIDDIASRPDLAQRCIHIELPPIVNRISETELSDGLAADEGAIFGALLDAVSLAIRDVGAVRFELPRMADFSQWAAAGIPALGFSSDEFIEAFRNNQAGAIESGLDTSGLAAAIRELMSGQSHWRGSTQELLSLLDRRVSDDARHRPGWPRSAKALVTALRRLAPSLRHVGIEFLTERKDHGRFLSFTCQPRRNASEASSRHRETGSDEGMTHLTHGQSVGTSTEQREEFDL